jgi:hypothetical protein
MLRRDDEQRVVIDASSLEGADNGSDRGIDVLDFAQQLRAGHGRCIGVSASGHARFVYGLADVYRLEIHTEDCRYEAGAPECVLPAIWFSSP